MKVGLCVGMVRRVAGDGDVGIRGEDKRMMSFCEVRRLRMNATWRENLTLYCHVACHVSNSTRQTLLNNTIGPCG